MGKRERLGEDVEGGGIGRKLGDGKAAAIDGDGVTELEFWLEGDFEPEACLVVARFDVGDAACGFDESCEHEVGDREFFISRGFRGRWRLGNLTGG